MAGPIDVLTAKVDALAKGMTDGFAGGARRFDGIDGRLDGIDGRLDGIDGRLDAHGRRFDAIDARLDAHGRRFDAIDARLDAHDGRFDGIDEHLRDIPAHFAELRAYIDTGLEKTQTALKGEIARVERKLDQFIDHELQR